MTRTRCFSSLPLTIWIKGECNVTHSSISQFLLELVTSVLNSLARCLNGVDTDTDMTEAFPRFRVAVVGLETVIILGAVVVGQLQQALTVGGIGAMGYGFGRVVGHEVKVEFGIGILDFADLLHSQKLIVLDFKEGIRQVKCLRIKGYLLVLWGSLTRIIVSMILLEHQGLY